MKNKVIIIILLFLSTKCFSADDDPRFGVSSIQGRRAYMEDRYKIDTNNNLYSYFSIFDGHAGASVSDYLSENLLKNIKIESLNIEIDEFEQIITSGIQETNKEIFDNHLNGGSTALFVYLYEGQIIVANIGDCRAVISNNGIAKQVSTDHKPDHPQEKARILKKGGEVLQIFGAPARLQGSLSLSRAFGDFEYHPYGLICEPTFVIEKIDENDFLILACDGLWETVGNQEAVDKVKEIFKAGQSCQSAADALKDLAYAKGSGDNITVIVIDLKKF